MGIDFLTVESIQVVVISSALSQAEAAATRNKLSQKLNRGRSKVVFDLTDYPLEDNTARTMILNVIGYSLNRGALTACCGVKPALWPNLLLEGNLQAKIFFSRSEALEFVKKAAVPKIKTEVPGEKSLAFEKPKSEKEIETEIKAKALDELLSKYLIFQQTDKDDPFRLEFFAEQYKKDPSGEALAAVKRALEETRRLNEEIDTLERECRELALKVKQGTLKRKDPVSAIELQLKEHALAAEIDELKSSTLELRTTISKRGQSALDLQEELRLFKLKLDHEFEELKREVGLLSAP